jgi:hypothetical protein
MSRPNLVRERFLNELSAWLSPDLIYHCFTGEDDPLELARIAKLDPWLLEPLLNKAEREWPDRLAQIAAARKREKKESKRAVQQFILDVHS